MKLGAEGYGIFFMLIERLREEEGYKSTIDYDTLAFDLRVEPEKVKQVVENYDLFKFTEDGKYFYSDSFNDRMEMMDLKSKKLAEAGRKGAEKRWGNKRKDSNPIATPKPPYSYPNSDLMAIDSNKIKLNKIKLNKTKLNKTKQQVTSSDKDVQELITMYQENFGVCNSLVINDIQNSLSMFDKDVVIESFRLSIGKDNPYLYMKGIWNKWKDEGINSIEQVRARNEQHEKNKTTKFKKRGYVEPVPDWLKTTGG